MGHEWENSDILQVLENGVEIRPKLAGTCTNRLIRVSPDIPHARLVSRGILRVTRDSVH